MVERAIGAERSAAEAVSGASSHGQWIQEVAALTRRWYIMLIRERLNLVFSIAQPAIWLIFFGSAVSRSIDKDVIGTSDYIGFMLPGIIAFTVVGNSVSGAMPLLWDKEQGYLDKLMSMPIARSSVIVSRFVFQLALGWAQTIIVLIVAAIMGVDFATGFAAVAVILITSGVLTLAFTSVFVGLAYYVPGHGTFFAITGFVTLPLLFMSNAFVPLDAMPGWMEIIARINPITYAITAMRLPTIEGWSAEIVSSLGVLLIASLICLAAGTHQFRLQTSERVQETGG